MSALLVSAGESYDRMLLQVLGKPCAILCVCVTKGLRFQKVAIGFFEKCVTMVENFCAPEGMPQKCILFLRVMQSVEAVRNQTNYKPFVKAIKRNN